MLWRKKTKLRITFSLGSNIRLADIDALMRWFRIKIVTCEFLGKAEESAVHGMTRLVIDIPIRGKDHDDRGFRLALKKLGVEKSQYIKML